MGLRNWLEKSVSNVGGGLRSWIGNWLRGKSSMTPSTKMVGDQRDREGAMGGVPPAHPGQGGDTGSIFGNLDVFGNPIGGPPDANDPPLIGAGDDEGAEVTGDWVQLTSSNVREIRYLAASRTLEVIFHNQYYYQYYDVEPEVFRQFVAASSPGAFVWNTLRADGYDYARIGTGFFPTQRVPSRRRFNVVRRLLPEERRQAQQLMDPLEPGRTVKKPSWVHPITARWGQLKAATEARMAQAGMPAAEPRAPRRARGARGPR